MMKHNFVENLEEILENHRRWLEGNTDTGAERAVLEGCSHVDAEDFFAWGEAGEDGQEE